MKNNIRKIGSIIILNISFVALLVLFSLNRGFFDEMMSLVMPLLLVTTSALLYTFKFKGDMIVTMSACLLLETGFMTQILILGEDFPKLLPNFLSQSKILLIATPVIGAIGVLVVSWLMTRDYSNTRRCITIMIITAVLTAAIMVVLISLGTEKNDTSAWIEVGTRSVQPTELLKLLFVFFHAVLWNSPLNKRREFFISCVLTVCLALMLFAINELGTLLVILLLWIIMTFIFSGKPIQALIQLIGTVIALLSGYGILFFIHNRVVEMNETGEKSGSVLSNLNEIYNKLHNRVMIVFNEEAMFSDVEYRNKQGYQFYKARELILKGGLFGTSSSTKVPVGASDYAYVGLILRCGIVFAILVLVLFFFIFYRSMLRSVINSDNFESIIITGAALSLILPTFINVMGTTNLSFMTGIAIPFISYGGTNMLVSIFCVMLVIWGTCQEHSALTRRWINKRKPSDRLSRIKVTPFTR